MTTILVEQNAVHALKLADQAVILDTARLCLTASRKMFRTMTLCGQNTLQFKPFGRSLWLKLLRAVKRALTCICECKILA